MEHKYKESFYGNNPRDINKSRIDFLKYLDLDIKNKSVLETGAGGIGQLSEYFLTHTDKLVINDGREENIQKLFDSIGRELPFNTWDLNEYEIPGDDVFDVVMSLGTLYHLYRPQVFIENFAKKCKEYMLISTMANASSDNDGCMVPEDINSMDQSISGQGVRAGRQWIVDEMKKSFKYVYFPKTQPSHDDFALDWRIFPVPTGPSGPRFIIIGSHNEMHDDKLTTELPTVYKDYRPINL